MTGEELYRAVTEMGFASSLEDNEDYFFRAANYALSTLSRTFSLSGEVRIAYTPGAAYYAEYDLTRLAPDLRSLPESPLWDGAHPLQLGRDYLYSGGRLRIAKRAPTELCLRYLRAPRPLTPDNLQEPLDVVPAAAHLPPLLVSSMLWLEDRPELAGHYLAMYRAEAEELRRSLRHHSADYRVLNGWDGV